MSDSDNDFLLPDNSTKPKSVASNVRPSFVSTPTPADGPSIGGPVTDNADYASNLLAARRRGLAQQRGGMMATNSPPVRRQSPTTQGSPLGNPSGGGMLTATPLIPVTTSSGRNSPAPASFNEKSSRDASPAQSRDHVTPLVAPVSVQPQFISTAPPVTTATPTPAPAATPAPTAAPTPQMIDPERIDKLRVEVEAKRRALAQVRERETAVTERVRAEKAKYAAELQLLEAKVKDEWRDVDEEKQRLDDEYRRVEEEQEDFLRREKKRIEEEVELQYLPKIAELQNELKELQAREQTLKQTLSAATANKDVVSMAISNAVSEIIKKIGDVFAASGEGSSPSKKMNDSNTSPSEELSDWEESIRRMVRSEIRTAFVSSVSNAAETERSEFAKSFEEMLRFWRDCEVEEQHHVMKMDEQLLLDLQSMAHEDLDRLQREEQSMEEVFMQSREQWTTHHSETLHRELQTAMERRAKEMETQRTLRNELHQRRLREIDEQHRIRLDHAKQMHQREIDLLRQEQSLHERLHDAKQQMLKRIQEDAMQATEGLHESAEAVVGILDRLGDLKRALEENRALLDKDRQKSLELREATLSDVQGLIVAQASSVEAERSSLSTALVKLEVTQSAVEKQLQQEQQWVAEVQGKLERSRADWEREYRRWQHSVAQEKRQSEQRFSHVLLQLNEAAAQLEEESREIEIEGNSMRRYCASRSAAVATEMASLERKEDELSHKHQQMLILLAELEAKSKHLTGEWQRVMEDRQVLASQRQELEKEELKLQQMTEHLEFMKQQMDATRTENMESAFRGRVMAHQLEASRGAARDGLVNVKRHAERMMTAPEPMSRFDMENQVQHSQTKARQPTEQWSNNPNRLPLKVLSELKRSLGMEVESLQRPSPAMYADPHDQQQHGPTSKSTKYRHFQSEQQESMFSPPDVSDSSLPPQRRHYREEEDRVDMSHEQEDMAHTVGGTSSYNFTNLVGISDAETTSLSQQTAVS